MRRVARASIDKLTGGVAGMENFLAHPASKLLHPPAEEPTLGEAK